jgi:transposase
MARAGPRKIQRYSLEFRLTAVRLSQLPGVQVQTVATALEIHPFMLSRWRKQVRDGVLRGAAPAARARTERELRRLQALEPELRRLQALERAHALLEEEHELLKKAIRFCSTRSARRSRSSTRSAGASR